MNIVGRFLAYKAMNAAWRSATRTSRSRSGGARLDFAGMESPTPAEMRRASVAMIAIPLTMLLGLSSCVAGEFGLGLALFWIGTPVAFISVAFLPSRWFKGNARHHGQERARRRSIDEEEARVKAHYAAYSTPDPAASASIIQEQRRQLLNGLREMSPEQFQAEYAAKEDTRDWAKDRWAYWKVARELEEDQPKETHSEAIDSEPSFGSIGPAVQRPYVVYFIQEKNADGKCKVGITYSLESRLRSLQTGNPHELEAVYTIQVSSKTSAEQIEEAVLNAVRNAGAEMMGEWFQGAILPWAKQVAETERQRIDSNLC